MYTFAVSSSGPNPLPGLVYMRVGPDFQPAALLLLLLAAPLVQAQPAANPPLPAIPELMHEVQEHQKQLEKVRENYTYTSAHTTQEIDSNGQMKKTETAEFEEF